MVALRVTPSIETPSVHFGALKAISLHQPWASLVALGLKTFETRHWAIKYRGPLVIHAAKKVDPYAKMKFAQDVPALRGPLPGGAMVCIVEVVDCIPVEQIRDHIGKHERSYGNYANGRYAWKLRLIERFPSPYTYPGQQGMFTWHRPVPARTVEVVKVEAPKVEAVQLDLTDPTPSPSPKIREGNKTYVFAWEKPWLLDDGRVMIRVRGEWYATSKKCEKAVAYFNQLNADLDTRNWHELQLRELTGWRPG